MARAVRSRLTAKDWASLRAYFDAIIRQIENLPDETAQPIFSAAVAGIQELDRLKEKQNGS